MEFFICIITIVVVIFLIYELYEQNNIKVSRYEIYFKKLPQEFNNYKIVQLSDLHSKSFGKNNYKLISKIDKINPDVIFMTGDIVDKYDINLKVIEKLINVLCKKYKIYYSIGNNEFELDQIRYNKLKNILQNNGVILLDNNKSRIYRKNEYINVYGMSYVVKKSDITFSKVSLLNKIDKNEFNISLLHNPDEHILYKDIDLFFCGHNHGGMVILGKVGLFGPSCKFFIKFVSGVYDVLEKSKMIVSRGLGQGRAIIRVNNSPDLVYTILKCKH